MLPSKPTRAKPVKRPAAGVDPRRWSRLVVDGPKQTPSMFLKCVVQL